MTVLEEQREDPRLDTYLGSSIQHNDENKRVFSVARNLSFSGAYLTTKKQFKKGSILDCMVSIEEDSIKFTGEVVRSIEDGAYLGYGLQITNIDEENKEKLENYITSSLKDTVEYSEPDIGLASQESGLNSNNNFFDYSNEAELIISDGKDSRLAQAGFPFYATLEDYDLTYQSSETRQQIENLMSLEWIEGTDNIMFFGPTGSGKTHLAVALGMMAIEEGYKVSFTSMRELINMLKAERESPIDRFKLSKMLDSRVLVIDEVGYIPNSKDEVNLLFQFTNKLYGRASVIMTTDLMPEQLKQAVGDSNVINLLLGKMTHNVWLRGFVN